MAASLCSLKVFLLVLSLQSFTAVKRSCYDSADCRLNHFAKNCCFGVCTERANCDGSCDVNSDCELSLDENCCKGYCKESSCYDKKDLVIGLSVAAAVVLFALIGIGICCAYRSRPAPGRIINQTVIRRPNRTRRVFGAPKQQYSRYQNAGSVNRGYEEFPQPPRYSSDGYRPPTNRGDQQPTSEGYQPSGYDWQQPPPVGGFQPSTTTAFSRESYQNNFNEGAANAGMGPPPPYIVAARSNAKLYAPQKSYGTETNQTQPSTPSS